MRYDQTKIERRSEGNRGHGGPTDRMVEGRNDVISGTDTSYHSNLLSSAEGRSYLLSDTGIQEELYAIPVEKGNKCMTNGGRVPDVECSFPFIWRGEVRNSCIISGRDAFWCPTKTTKDLNTIPSEWGYCSSDCDLYGSEERIEYIKEQLNDVRNLLHSYHGQLPVCKSLDPSVQSVLEGQTKFPQTLDEHYPYAAEKDPSSIENDLYPSAEEKDPSAVEKDPEEKDQSVDEGSSPFKFQKSIKWAENILRKIASIPMRLLGIPFKFTDTEGESNSGSDPGHQDYSNKDVALIAPKEEINEENLEQEKTNDDNKQEHYEHNEPMPQIMESSNIPLENANDNYRQEIDEDKEPKPQEVDSSNIHPELLPKEFDLDEDDAHDEYDVYDDKTNLVTKEAEGKPIVNDKENNDDEKIYEDQEKPNVNDEDNNEAETIDEDQKKPYVNDEENNDETNAFSKEAEDKGR